MELLSKNLIFISTLVLTIGLFYKYASFNLSEINIVHNYKSKNDGHHLPVFVFIIPSLYKLKVNEVILDEYNVT